MKALSNRCARRGFTLIELLVVMAIIGVLISMLLPVLGAVRERARRTQCINRMKQINIAVHTYFSRDEKQQFPAGNKSTTKGGTAVDQSWLFTILPFIDSKSMHDQLNKNEAWNSLANAPFTSVSLPAFRCPSAEAIFDGQGDYAGITGSNKDATSGGASTLANDTYKWERYVTNAGPPVETATRYSMYGSGILITTVPSDSADPLANPYKMIKDPVRDAEITDGGSHTMIFAEDAARTAAQLGNWANGNQIIGVDNVINSTTDNSNANEISSKHPGGAIVAFESGPARFLSDDIAIAILARLAIRNDGEVIGGDDLE